MRSPGHPRATSDGLQPPGPPPNYIYAETA